MATFEDNVPDIRPGLPAGAVALFGFVKRAGFSAFMRSPEYWDGAPDPLKRWSKRLIDGLANETGGGAGARQKG